MSNSKSKHKRREKYWKIYHRAHSKEPAFLEAPLSNSSVPNLEFYHTVHLPLVVLYDIYLFIVS